MFDRLTEKQREVLELVADSRTSKEIARTLAISESAVIQRIESVRRLANGAPRAELARLWRTHVAQALPQETPCKPLTGQSSHIPEAAESGDNPDVGRAPDGDATASFPVQGSHLPPTDRSSIVPAALDGPQGTFHRIALVVLLAAAMLLIVLAALSVVDNLASIDRSPHSLPRPGVAAAPLRHADRANGRPTENCCMNDEITHQPAAGQGRHR